MPKRPLEDASPAELRVLFLAKLDEIQAWFREHGIEYRIIGSLATSSYLNDPALARFGRPGARLVHQQVPDVDLLIPHADLPRVEPYRRALATAEGFSINLEIHPSAVHIDFRPDEKLSYLTHRNLRMPVPTSLFRPVERSFFGHTIVTLELNTLYHTFVTNGGVMRDKDWPVAHRLAKLIMASGAGFHDVPEYREFHRFIRARRRKYPVYIFFKWILPKTREHVPGWVEYLGVQIAKFLELKLFRSR